MHILAKLVIWFSGVEWAVFWLISWQRIVGLTNWLD